MPSASSSQHKLSDALNRSHARLPETHPATNRAQLEPLILTRASLDEKVITLRLAPRVATSIRLPEPVNSVVVGDRKTFRLSIPNMSRNP